MARPLRLEFEGAFYHVTARGNERKNIYTGETDYQKFLTYVKEAQKKYGMVVHAYVLMTNHYHLLLETPEANLSRAMHHINSSYTTYINVKQKRCGHLFQGRYKSILIERDSYLTELSRYIHLNPVRAGLVDRPEAYQYSSYLAYTTSKGDYIANSDLVLGALSADKKEARAKYKTFVEAAIGKEMESPVRNSYGGIMLGKERFIKETLKRIKKDYLSKGEVAQRKALRNIYGMDEILDHVAAKYKATTAEILKGKPALAKKTAIYLIRKNSGLSNREVGTRFGGLSYSAVAKICKRLEDEIKRSPSVRKVVAGIERNMSNVKG